jgi:hypothetical protein
MKKFLITAAVATALTATSAQAETNERHYAGPQLGGWTATNPQNGFLGGLTTALLDAGVANGVGTRYVATASAAGNTQTATPTVTNTFALSGNVTKDCSFYAGNNASARNLDFGTIGVRTGNNENVSDAFEMVAAATANVNSATAGCNFNNTVTITKANGSSGMVNAAPGGYDSSQFQANIPYLINASWTGVGSGSVANGSAQSLNVAANAGTANIAQGAWRSAFNMAIVAPVAAKALVAGNYSDTVTLTLAAQ